MGTNRSIAELFEGAVEVERLIAAREAEPADLDPDVSLKVAHYHPKRIALVVDEVIVETPSSRTLRVSEAGGGELPAFLAGQYVNLFVDIDGVATSRPLAISSSPARRDSYDLTIRRVPGGRVSGPLIDRAAPGDRLSSTGPMGTFHHNPLFHGDDLVFLAGGSGVAPAMSMVRDIVDHDLPLRLHILYGSRSQLDVIFGDELDAIAAADERIRVDHVILDPEPGWTGPTGLLTAETITALAGPLDGRMVYVCGPPAMYPHSLEQLATLGHPRRRVRFEANGPPTDPSAEPGWPAGVDPAGEVKVTVAGRTSFSTPRNRPLLEALEDHGIQPETACRSGECSLCRVRVLSGEVFSAPQALLRMADERFGYVHSCVAYPISDVEVAL